MDNPAADESRGTCGTAAQRGELRGGVQARRGDAGKARAGDGCPAESRRRGDPAWRRGRRRGVGAETRPEETRGMGHGGGPNPSPTGRHSLLGDEGDAGRQHRGGDFPACRRARQALQGEAWVGVDDPGAGGHHHARRHRRRGDAPVRAVTAAALRPQAGAGSHSCGLRHAAPHQLLPRHPGTGVPGPHGHGRLGAASYEPRSRIRGSRRRASERRRTAALRKSAQPASSPSRDHGRRVRRRPEGLRHQGACGPARSAGFSVSRGGRSVPGPLSEAGEGLLEARRGHRSRGDRKGARLRGPRNRRSRFRGPHRDSPGALGTIPSTRCGKRW